MLKWMKRLILLAVLLAAVAVVAAWLGVNYAAKKGIETAGTYAFGADTEVDSVSIGWLSSSVGIKGFEVENPEGYRTKRLIALKRGKVACDVSTLLSDHVVVKEIVLDAPELTIELKPGIPPKSNLGQMLQRLKAYESPEGKSEKTFEVGLIRVTNAKVRFHLVGGQTIDVKVPKVELTEVANDDGTPLLLADIFGQVLAALGDEAFKGAKGVVPSDALKVLGGTVGSVSKLLGTGAKGVGQVGKELGKGLKGIAEGLGGILGGRKDDEEKK